MTGLQCLRCGAEYAMDPWAYLCTACGADHEDPGVLDVRYDYAAARGKFEERQDLFRYLPLLPVRGPGAVLNAGGTPLVAAPRLAARLGLKELYLKDETRNPTRSLKDRATAIAATLAIEAGAKDVYCSSAGNAAISLAGFSAHAGLRCHVFVPSYTSTVRLDWLKRFGADTRVSSGNYDQAFAEAEEAGREQRWYSRNSAFNPFLVEGKKTCGLEIAEKLQPDFVIAPVGDGCTLSGIGKGFREARQMGWIDRLPKLIGVQAEGVQPMVSRVRGTKAPEGDTQAASIAVRKPHNALRLIREIRESGGEMIAVCDSQISGAQRRLAAEAGLVAEFASATTLAALEAMVPRPGQVGVLVITGGRVD